MSNLKLPDTHFDRAADHKLSVTTLSFSIVNLGLCPHRPAYRVLQSPVETQATGKKNNSSPKRFISLNLGLSPLRPVYHTLQSPVKKQATGKLFT